jgi:hypothetical protein
VGGRWYEEPGLQPFSAAIVDLSICGPFQASAATCRELHHAQPPAAHLPAGVNDLAVADVHEVVVALPDLDVVLLAAHVLLLLQDLAWGLGGLGGEVRGRGVVSVMQVDWATWTVVLTDTMILQDCTAAAQLQAWPPRHRQHAMFAASRYAALPERCEHACLTLHACVSSSAADDIILLRPSCGQHDRDWPCTHQLLADAVLATVPQRSRLSPCHSPTYSMMNWPALRSSRAKSPKPLAPARCCANRVARAQG